MLTREEILKIDRECKELNIKRDDYLDRNGITRHNYYRSKRHYKDEDVNVLAPAGFVPVMPGVENMITTRPGRKPSNKAKESSESFLSIEIRTSNGSAMRIQGGMKPEHLRELIFACNVQS